ncbi:ABC transporter permease [Limnohabitans sp. MMS-10A-178]|jgi:phosphonate transport system permease protein|uniref:PhnE/PtxC family ABC transporter permease n=1 Tax=Limnohabitans sp. MMS-10A-178 TaxID=1835767 RepID=UPI000D3B002B|nr:ABC transporter permease subunit [Limnohabitans sp. MMS-10A-178]PUE15006.1 ABC transporter permease [Limnohabitans sp. MMS-10A-178]
MSATNLPQANLAIAGKLRDPDFSSRIFWLTFALLLLWPLGVATEFRPWVLWEPENLKVSRDFLASFWPLVYNAEFMQMVVKETWRTVAMATAGVTLALMLAIPMSLMATRVLSLSALTGRMDRWPAVLRWCVRATLILLRSIPELVWALVFVRVVGLGPTAGVLAIALTYGGMLGKVYAEILESGESHATHTLMRNGSGRLQAFVYALLPTHAAELASYTVYRWECAIRSSVVLGFVGAGGLGQQLDNSMKMFNGGEVATLLLIFIVLVALADSVSAWLRRALS